MARGCTRAFNAYHHKGLFSKGIHRSGVSFDERNSHVLFNSKDDDADVFISPSYDRYPSCR